MGEKSGGRSLISPTRVRSRSWRTRIERQYSQTVCTALDHRKRTGAPQLGTIPDGLAHRLGAIIPVARRTRAELRALRHRLAALDAELRLARRAPPEHPPGATEVQPAEEAEEQPRFRRPHRAHHLLRHRQPGASPKPAPAIPAPSFARGNSASTAPPGTACSGPMSPDHVHAMR